MSTGMLSTYTQHVIRQNSRATEGKIIFSSKKNSKNIWRLNINAVSLHSLLGIKHFGRSASSVGRAQHF